MGKLLIVLALVALVYFWWRGRASRLTSMPVAEARALLGVDDSADADAVRAAHKRIITRVHPDAGGTADLARRANLARDVLLKELGRDLKN